ncbi:MAG TPA: PxKF domain-containing protein [Candidatus Methylomirabilis sp.]|nr:PxKF domain-containing protein [Candidatus Methylomirabilis sp.]
MGPGDQVYVVWQDRRNNPNYEVFLGNDQGELGIVGAGGRPSVAGSAAKVLCVWESTGRILAKTGPALVGGSAQELSPEGYFPDTHVNEAGLGYAVWNANDWSLGYAKYEINAWGPGATSTVGSAYYPSVAVDVTGNPHVSFGEGSTRYATLSGAAWTTPEDVRPSNAYYPSLGIDRSNNLHLAWIDTASGNSEIYYSTKKLSNLFVIDNVPYYNQGPTSCDEYYRSHPNETRKAEPCVGGGPWATDTYDGTSKTVRSLGCAITSAVMVMRKMGVDNVCYDNNYVPCSGNAFNNAANWRDVNPRTLNEWAKRNGGYDSSGGFYFLTVLGYTNNQIELYKKIESRNDNVLNLALGLKLPPVIHIPGHYMVATGQQAVGANPNWYVNDPGRYSSVVLTDRSSTYDRLRVFRPTVFSEGYSALEVHLGSPAEFLLTDPAGRRAGYDPVSGAVVNEIPDFEYGPERIDDAETGEPGHEVKVLYIGRPLPGAYDVKVIGTGSGGFNLSVVALDNAADKTFNAFTGTTAPSRVYDYRIDYLVAPDFPTIVTASTYQFLGFQPPIQSDGSKVFKLGSTIPVKFQVRRIDRSPAQDVTATLALQRYTNGIPVGEPIDASPTGGSDSGNLFRYDPQEDQYIYNLSTKTLSVGNWKLIVTLDDGSAYDVLIGLK